MTMDIDYKDNTIKFEKELNKLDKFVIDFTTILNKLNIKYVIVSGYVSILFGRNRNSEDIDLIVENLDFDKFKVLWDELFKNFECINTHDINGAYDDCLLNHTSIRFSRKGEYMPNMEFKFPDELNELEIVSLKERKKAILNNNLIFISPLELQISFKFFLGSEKDIGDALYLYEIFKNKLDLKLINSFSKKLKVEDLSNKYIK